MGLRDLIKTKIDPDETLLGLKLTWTRNGVKIDPDKAGRVALIRVKISSGNAGFERAVLPGASTDHIVFWLKIFSNKEKTF